MRFPATTEILDLDFRAAASLRIVAVSLLVLCPFIPGLLLHQQAVSTIGLLAVIVVSLPIIYRSHHRQWFILLLLVPAIVFFLAGLILDRGIHSASWLFPVVIAYYHIMDEQKAWCANAITLAIALPVVWLSAHTEATLPIIASLAVVSIFSVIGARVTCSYHRSLKTLATTDSLTGLLNRSLLKITLQQAIEQHQRASTPMTLLYLDIDHFKSINDNYGHAAGDDVLTGIGNTIRNTTRLSDSCFRSGGEEFVCLLYGSDLSNGKRLAESMRQRIQSSSLLEHQEVTISIGVASLGSRESRDQWCRRADDNLYAAKCKGRNQVAG